MKPNDIVQNSQFVGIVESIEGKLIVRSGGTVYSLEEVKGLDIVGTVESNPRLANLIRMGGE